MIWVKTNARKGPENNVTGPLTTQETSKHVKFWIRRIQTRNANTEKFTKDQQQLHLKKNDEGIYECRGRVQRDYPVYLPDNESLTNKIVMHSHKLSCHGE